MRGEEREKGSTPVSLEAREEKPTTLLDVISLLFPHSLNLSDRKISALCYLAQGFVKTNELINVNVL